MEAELCHHSFYKVASVLRGADKIGEVGQTARPCFAYISLCYLARSLDFPYTSLLQHGGQDTPVTYGWHAPCPVSIEDDLLGFQQNT